MNGSHQHSRGGVISRMAWAFSDANTLIKESVMRRLMLIGIGLAVMAGASLSLTGCVVVAPRRHYVARVWVPGYWAPAGVYVSGHWRA
jgi:hypothetical protein